MSPWTLRPCAADFFSRNGSWKVEQESVGIRWNPYAFGPLSLEIGQKVAWRAPQYPLKLPHIMFSHFDLKGLRIFSNAKKNFRRRRGVLSYFTCTVKVVEIVPRRVPRLPPVYPSYPPSPKVGTWARGFSTPQCGPHPYLAFSGTPVPPHTTHFLDPKNRPILGR